MFFVPIHLPTSSVRAQTFHLHFWLALGFNFGVTWLNSFLLWSDSSWNFFFVPGFGPTLDSSKSLANSIHLALAVLAELAVGRSFLSVARFLAGLIGGLNLLVCFCWH